MHHAPVNSTTQTCFSYADSTCGAECHTVTSIGSHAFYNCSSLTSINIPSGVPIIGENTFYGCSSLTSMTIPASVTSIGNDSFYGCTGLTNMTMPEVTSIGTNAFYNCTNITSVTITKVTRINSKIWASFSVKILWKPLHNDDKRVINRNTK